MYLFPNGQTREIWNGRLSLSNDDSAGPSSDGDGIQLLPEQSLTIRSVPTTQDLSLSVQVAFKGLIREGDFL